MSRYQRTSDLKNLEDFEQLYREREDPWALRSFDEKRVRGLETVRMLEGRRFRLAVDLCCGEGSFTHRLSHFCSEVIGVDVSSTAIERAREKYSDCRFIVEDVLKVDLEQIGSPDLILALDSWYFFDADQKEELMKHLRRFSAGRTVWCLTSARINRPPDEDFWPGRDFETINDFATFTQRHLHIVLQRPVHLRFEPAWEIGLLARSLALGFRVIAKLAGYRRTLRLAQWLHRRRWARRAIEPLTIHYAILGVAAEPAH